MSTPQPGVLRAARRARGWSQSDAAREVAALARARGTPVAHAASLKTLLSRWENGHAVPEPQYRSLLGELFGRTPAELGIDGPGDAGRIEASRLLERIAAAAAVDGPALDLWREQLAVARRLDDELGAAGAGAVVTAQVDQLDRTLAHTLTPRARGALASVLAGTATLAGSQALDRCAHDEAWSHYDRARAAATEADLPVSAAIAHAGLAAVLVDAGDIASATTLLDHVEPAGPVTARIRWEAARGLVRAAAGEAAAAEAALSSAEQALGRVTVDRAEAITSDPGAPAFELADMQRWQGRALVTLGDAAAVEPLERALAARPRAARHRAGLHADLAAALEVDHPETAAAHARTARALAERIGSARIIGRLSRSGGGG